MPERRGRHPGERPTSEPECRSATPLATTAIAAVFALALASLPARAQVREPHHTITAGEGAAKLSEVSRSVGEDSPSVHDPFSTTVGEASIGTVRSGPVSGMGSRSMKSGPVSDISRGPITSQRRAAITSGAVTELSAGAVKHDIAKALGERISQPLHELAPLQQEIRRRREQAELAAIAGLGQPAPAPAVELSVPDARASGDEESAEGENKIGDAEDDIGLAAPHPEPDLNAGR